MTHLLLPSTVTQKLLIAQASYCRIKKLRARLTPKCKKLNIHKCGFLQIRSHIYICAYVTVRDGGTLKFVEEMGESVFNIQIPLELV